MAGRATNNGGLEWDEFRALEYFAILYDIAIDQEDFNPGWCRVTPQLSDDELVRHVERADYAKIKPWTRHYYQLFPVNEDSAGDLPDVGVNANIDPSRLPLLDHWQPPETLEVGARTLAAVESSKRVASFWRRLLVAKYARAKLQEDGSTPALDALDQVGLALLRAMPQHDPEFRIGQRSRLQLFILRLLYLNEASQCFGGGRAIAYANDCLDLIRRELGRLRLGPKEDGTGVTPYELVALYNKGQGYLHSRDHEKALKEFRKVRECKDDLYFSAEEPATLTWRVEDQPLFKAYLFAQSRLQIADTCLNLQLSGEANLELKKLQPLTDYQRLRGEILRCRSSLDQVNLSGCIYLVPAYKGVWKRPRVRARNILIQYLSVRSQLYQARLAARAEDLRTDSASSTEPGPTMHDAARNLRRWGAALHCRLRHAKGERSETDQAVASWAEGLGTCAEVIRSARERLRSQDKPSAEADEAHIELIRSVRCFFDLPLPKPWGKTDRLRLLALDQALDPEYRDYKDKVRKHLVEDGFRLLEHLEQRPCSMDRKSSAASRAETAGRDQLSKLYKQVRDYNLDVVERLLKIGPGYPEYEKHWWRELERFYRDEDLPLDSPDDSNEKLRQFLKVACVRCGEVARNCPCKCRCFDEETKPQSCTDERFTLGADFIDRDGWKHYFDRIRATNEDIIQKRLYRSRPHTTPSGWGLAILQRWNSYTPALAASEGGGYFLFHSKKPERNEHNETDIGLVIDPGYGFVRNFLSEGFGVCDISAIAVTHDHPDHLADFQAIVNLLLEARKERGGRRSGGHSFRPVEALLSDGAFDHLLGQVESARPVFRNTQKLKAPDVFRNTQKPKAPGSPIELKIRNSDSVMKIRATAALHIDASDQPDHSGYDTVGLVAELPNGGGRPVRVALPSDTKWSKQVAYQYLGEETFCDVLCLHVGSIAKKSDWPIAKYFSEKETTKGVLLKGWHLYLPGTLWFVEAIVEALRARGSTATSDRQNQRSARGLSRARIDRLFKWLCDRFSSEALCARGSTEGGPVLVILSEFGEEMRGGLRILLAKLLQEHVDKQDSHRRLLIVPGDVGLLVDPVDRSIQCSCCRHFYPWGRTPQDRTPRLTFEPYGDAERIFYVCPSCSQALSYHQRAAIFADYQTPIYRRPGLSGQ